MKGLKNGLRFQKEAARVRNGRKALPRVPSRLCETSALLLAAGSMTSETIRETLTLLVRDPRHFYLVLPRPKDSRNSPHFL
jgi:hypothetical protein